MVNNVLNIDSKQFKISWNVDEFIILSVYQKVVENVNRDKTQILKEGSVWVEIKGLVDEFIKVISKEVKQYPNRI